MAPPVYLFFQVSFGAYEGAENQFAFQGTLIVPPNPPTVAPGPPWLGDEWWGPFDDTIPTFPLNPTLGFVPGPETVVDLGEPALWAFDSGFVGSIGIATFREASSWAEAGGDMWWGPQDPLEPLFPLNPTLGYVPTPPVVSNAPPAYALWAFDSGFIGYIRNAA